MIFLDNIIFSLQRTGGISVVWKNLIQNLLLKTSDIKFIEYDKAQLNIFRAELDILASKICHYKSFNRVLNQIIQPNIKSEKPFIFHSSYFRTCKNPMAINVTTVHDFIYEQGKMSYLQKLRIALNYNAIRKSDAIVCISQNTKKDLFKYLPDIDPSKVYVIYNGVSQDYYPMNEIPYPDYRNHVLFVGGRQGYKNFDFLVKALENSDYKLLICGAPLTKDEILLLNRRIPNRYNVIKYPSNVELNKIYNSVYCLVYPSSYEGFGLPVLEAQRAGCPVIALAASSIPEIVGDCNLLMPDLSNNELLQKLNSIEESAVKNDVVRCGLETACRFSWNKMTEEYLNLYIKLLNINH